MSFQRITPDNAAALTCLGSVPFGWISQLRWSPRGDMLAVCGGEGIALYINDFGKSPTFRLDGQGMPVKAIAFSADGKQLATGGADTTVKLWTIGDGRPVESAILQGHQSAVDAVTFSPEGRWLATAGADCTIRLWDATTGAHGALLAGHSDEVTTLSFDATGQLLLSGSRDKTIRCWDLNAGNACLVLYEHDNWIREISCAAGRGAVGIRKRGYDHQPVAS